MILAVLNQKRRRRQNTLNLGTALADAGCEVLLANLDLQPDLVADGRTVNA